MSISIIYLKPTNFCNVGCDHCYLTLETRQDKEVMQADTLDQVARTFGEMKAFYGQNSLEILWHGGEPLLMPVSWYDAASEVLDRHLGPHTQSMQTSLIPFKKDFVPFIKQRLGGGLGASFDFNSRKLNGSWNEYERLFLKKLEMAREDNISVGIIMTVSKLELGYQKEIVQWFENNGFTSFRCERYTQYLHPVPNYVTNKDVSDWNIGLFDHLLERIREGKSPIVEDIVTAGINVAYRGRQGDRWGTTCTSDFFVVEPNGDVFNCTDRAGKEPPMGHVSMGWEGLLTSPERLRMIQEHTFEKAGAGCQSCTYFETCRGGCPILPTGESTDLTDCVGSRHFLDHIRMVADTQEGQALIETYLASAEESRVRVRNNLLSDELAEIVKS